MISVKISLILKYLMSVKSSEKLVTKGRKLTTLKEVYNTLSRKPLDSSYLHFFKGLLLHIEEMFLQHKHNFQKS
jgi:hypothetical protein